MAKTNYRRASSKENMPHVQDLNDEGVDDDNKAAKAQRTQTARLKQFVICFLVFSAISFLIGRKLEADNAAAMARISPISAISSTSSGATSVQLQKPAEPTEFELQEKVDVLDHLVRKHKAQPDIIMETDPEGIRLTKSLQMATLNLLKRRYGPTTTKFRVRVDLVFPSVITNKDGLPAEGSYVMIEMAPFDLIPCSVYNFLEIARTFKSASFHRNADHVLQVGIQSGVKKPMPFQEYSPDYPHAKGTVGYAGRPSGPGWYISIKDNTRNHGPGSQQQRNPHEADSLFGRVVEGFDDVVPRIHSTPQMGWLDKEHKIQISKMTILISPNNRADEWVPWKPSSEDHPLQEVTDLSR